MSAAFTPGPWMVSGASFDCDEGHVAYHIRADGMEACTANAHLIEAAPEMFEALDRIVSETHDRRDLTSRLVNRLAFDALAKARG